MFWGAASVRRAARGVLGASAGVLVGPSCRRYDAKPVRSEVSPADPLEEGFEVCLVQVLCRHGARTPIGIPKWMPKPGSDEWSALWGQCRERSIDSTVSVRADSGMSLTGEAAGVRANTNATGVVKYGTCGSGSLTKIGEDQLKQLGQYLHQRYLEGCSGRRLDLTPSFSEGHLKVVSTRTSRTILSATCLLKGLFPQEPEAALQALIEIDDPARTFLYANHARCDRLRQFFHEEMSSLNAELQSVSTRLRLISELGPEPEHSKASFINIGDALRSLHGHGHPLPPGYSKALADELNERGHEVVDANMGRGSLEIQRLSMGLLIADMTAQIKTAMAGESPLRLMVRSAHDVSIAGVMAALRLPSHGWPGFASSIILELLREKASGRYYVRLIVHDGVPSAQSTIVDLFVPVEAWLQSVKPLVLNEAEYEKECRLPPGVPSPPPQQW
mmetsp:Transcript_35895/g.81251  ORF Transcript_35895/g.81251 Transcript_35895/m.81251 type:complete len:446 (+) Transcript_35895:54-1391(+)